MSLLCYFYKSDSTIKRVMRQHTNVSPDNMSRVEYLVKENLYTVSCCLFFASVAISLIGRKTLQAVDKANSGFADLVFKKNIFRICFALMMCIFTTYLMIDSIKLIRHANVPMAIQMEQREQIAEEPTVEDMRLVHDQLFSEPESSDDEDTSEEES